MRGSMHPRLGNLLEATCMAPPRQTWGRALAAAATRWSHTKTVQQFGCHSHTPAAAGKSAAVGRSWGAPLLGNGPPFGWIATPLSGSCFGQVATR